MGSFEIYGRKLGKNVKTIVTPIEDESVCVKPEEITDVNSPDFWAWVADGVGHGKFPAIILAGLLDIWGTESEARKYGYRKCRMTPWIEA